MEADHIAKKKVIQNNRTTNEKFHDKTNDAIKYRRKGRCRRRWRPSGFNV